MLSLSYNERIALFKTAIQYVTVEDIVDHLERTEDYHSDTHFLDKISWISVDITRNNLEETFYASYLNFNFTQKIGHEDDRKISGKGMIWGYDETFRLEAETFYIPENAIYVNDLMMHSYEHGWNELYEWLRIQMELVRL